MSVFTGRMAGVRKRCRVISPGFIAFFMVFFLLSVNIHAQVDSPETNGKKKIELIYADEDRIIKDPETGKDLHRIIGNVELKHNDIYMLCDSAHFLPDKNQVTAFSNIHIEQGDTLELFGNYLFYDGKTGMAFMKDEVELIDKETHLFTDSIEYNVNERVARYTNRGHIINGENRLYSIIGMYFANEKLFHFKDSVEIINPDYIMTADTMDYNTVTETAFFTGPSELNGDSLYLYCEKGWYDTKNDITAIWENAVIDNRQQIISADSMFFNDNTGYGESFGNVVIKDTTDNIMVEGRYAWYYKQPERFLITDRAVFIQYSGGDSLYLHADTITAVSVSDSSLNEFRLMKAYSGCRIFSEDMQAVSDSITYSTQDSVIRFYKAPVLWSEENQLTTNDSLAIFTRNGQADRLVLYNSAFITSQIDTVRFNQIKGRSLTGYFSDNELYKIEIDGNGESIYYLLDGDEVSGVSNSTCERIIAYIENGEITEVTEHGNPDGLVDPPKQENPEAIRLSGFNWLNDIRPKNKRDIFSE